MPEALIDKTIPRAASAGKEGGDGMSNEENAAPGAAARARTLAEQALHAQAAGQVDEADRLFSEAQQLDPDAVAVVLSEHDAAVAPDARDTPAANQDAERVRR